MKLVFAALLVAAVLLAGCAGQAQQNAPSGSQPAAPSGSQPSAPSGSQPSGGQAAAGSGTDLASCLADCDAVAGTGLGNACKIGCHMDNAEGQKDASLCDPINGYANSSLFYMTCLGDVAGEIGSGAPCDRAVNVSEKDWCLVTASDTLKDPSICAGINDSILKSVCMDNVNTSSQ